jgi:hypothetical protein
MKRDKTGKATEMHDDLVLIGKRIGEMLLEIHEACIADREMCGKLLDEQKDWSAISARVEQLEREVGEHQQHTGEG